MIVAVDSRCQADEQWYMRNRTQPNLNQPWYHVLVDGQATTTYAAETSLQADPSAEPIDHPLVEVFFDGFERRTLRPQQTTLEGVVGGGDDND